MAQECVSSKIQWQSCGVRLKLKYILELITETAFHCPNFPGSQLGEGEVPESQNKTLYISYPAAKIPFGLAL